MTGRIPPTPMPASEDSPPVEPQGSAQPALTPAQQLQALVEAEQRTRLEAFSEGVKALCQQYRVHLVAEPRIENGLIVACCFFRAEP